MNTERVFTQQELSVQRERCLAVKQVIKNALAILSSGQCGEGRGADLAMEHLEDAHMRVDFHMKKNYLHEPILNTAVKPAPPRSTLNLIQGTPTLRTGIMDGPPPAPTTPQNGVKTSKPADSVYQGLSADILDSISILP